MSSVLSAPRQRVVGNTAFNVGTATTLYTFIAGSGNVVGNYNNVPLGSMVAIGTATAGTGGVNSVFGSPIFRDMGKTIQASVGTTGTIGFFRQVQLINPVSVASPTSVTNFGVNGSVPGTIPSGNPGDDGYNTFYIAISVGGVVPSTASVDYGVGPIAANVL